MLPLTSRKTADSYLDCGSFYIIQCVSRAVSALTVVGAVALTGATWWQSHSLWKSALMAALCFLVTFGKKVWDRLQLLWAERLASKIDQVAAIWVAGYDRRYTRHLCDKYWAFDVKGFSTQSPFPLELEKVYVELTVNHLLASMIPGDLISVPEDLHKNNPVEISILLRAKAGRSNNFAIVGPPGSGKSTMLKHLTLRMATGRGPLELTPLLIGLHEHAAAIEANPLIKLAELVEISLKDVPPPPGWCERRLSKGKCLVMLDGMDEVVDAGVRHKVASWIERQTAVYGSNRFLVSSRPRPYEDDPLAGFETLYLCPFSRKQVEQFIRGWYLTIEVLENPEDKDDARDRLDANWGADDLLERLRRTPTLQNLAVNPLLLTVIVTLHRYGKQLPEQLVELFAELCDVCLGRRQQARGLRLDVASDKKLWVLRLLAYQMMCRELSQIARSEVEKIIAESIEPGMLGMEPDQFVQMVGDTSGLVVEKEVGIYAFAHLSFQEYLASVHIKTAHLEKELCRRVRHTWWHGTARLYSAQADASPIVEECLSSPRPNLDELVLATDCAAESKTPVRGDLSDRLRRLTSDAVEDQDPERRRLAAEHMLTKRMRDMTCVSSDLCLDRSPITHAEYQLFIEQMLIEGKNYRPDHWNTDQFPGGSGLTPVVGIRVRDAETFCSWLAKKDNDIGEWTYSLASFAEIESLIREHSSWRSLKFVTRNSKDEVSILQGEEILSRIANDVRRVALEQEFNPRLGRIYQRLIWFALWAALNRDRFLHADVHRDLELILSVAFDQAINRDLNHALDRTRAGDLNFDLSRGQTLHLGFDLVRGPLHVKGWELDSDTARDFDVKYLRDSDGLAEENHARVAAKAVAEGNPRDVALAKAALVLNWLCTIEKRAEGEIPAIEAFWLSKVLQNSNGSLQDKVAVR